MISVSAIDERFELIDSEEFGSVCVVEGVDFVVACDVFAANWPEHANELDKLKEDYIEFFGVRNVVRIKAQRVSSGSKKKPGSGARFRELIMAGKSNDECLKIVRAEFPESKATLSDAAWNRAQIRKNPSGFRPDGRKA